MGRLVIVAPEGQGGFSQKRLETALRRLVSDARWIRDADELEACQDAEVLFAIALDAFGMNAGYDRMKRRIATERELLKGTRAAVVVDGPGTLFTKSVGRELVFRANHAGCAFIPRALIEATGTLYNFELRASLLGVSLEQAYHYHLAGLIGRLSATVKPKHHTGRSKLLVLCATDRLATANTVALWHEMERHLPNSVETQLVNIGKGKVFDCFGCSYTSCCQKGCPQRDILTDHLYQAVVESDGLLLLVPNLNDALGPDMAALLNRMTHLANTDRIQAKPIFSLVVSGYSGGDIITRQILNGFCLNKGFSLPPYFSMMETANRPLSILDNERALMHAAHFSTHIARTLLP